MIGDELYGGVPSQAHEGPVSSIVENALNELNDKWFVVCDENRAA
jgi:hypothetical protein